MPIHDWTRVKPGIFHHFHQAWISAIARVLNQGVLPEGYYALAEQVVGDTGPDVLALKRPVEEPSPSGERRGGGVAMTIEPPKARFHGHAEMDQYAAKANVISVRHSSDDQVIAVVEIVSPGNKSSRRAANEFLKKATNLLTSGIHLLIADLFPPGRFDPNGLAAQVWEEFGADEPFEPPEDMPLAIASFRGGTGVESFIEPAAVGDRLIDMPLFLDRENYVRVPLESTYQSAWDAVPAVWRDVVTGKADRA